MTREKQEQDLDKTENGQKQVQELKAGRELDALVAEAMGWRQAESNQSSHLVTGFTVIDGSGHYLGWWRYDQPKFGDAQPHYSSDIAAAMGVVDRMADGWYIEIRNYFRPVIGADGFIDESTPDRMYWIATFERVGPSDKEYSEEATTPALAICLAALKAVGAATEEVKP